MRSRAETLASLLVVLMVWWIASTSVAAADATIAQTSIPVVERLLALLSNPNLAYLLLVSGLMALVAEISAPGASFPGVAGVILLIMAMVGLLQLPTNWVGVLLIVAAVVMFLLDLKVGGVALSIGALIALGLGSLLVFTPFWVDAPAGAAQLNPWLVIGTVLAVEAFFALGLSRAMQAQRSPVAVGRETLIGQRAVVTKELAPVGAVRVESEEWSAISADGATVPVGVAVEVIGLEGLVLRVWPVSGD
jgi:membrane-bound serine protease (ClpP class)